MMDIAGTCTWRILPGGQIIAACDGTLWLVMSGILATAVFLFLVVIVYVRHWIRQKNEVERLRVCMARMRELHARTLLGDPISAEIKARAVECWSIIDGRPEEEWFGDLRKQVLRFKDELNKMVSEVGISMPPQMTSTADVIRALGELARLRSQGVITDEEFQGFSRAFTGPTRIPLTEIIAAIEALHRQFKEGAMTEGEYQAALWGLFDKLDRKA